MQHPQLVSRDGVQQCYLCSPKDPLLYMQAQVPWLHDTDKATSRYQRGGVGALQFSEVPIQLPRTVRELMCLRASGWVGNQGFLSSGRFKAGREFDGEIVRAVAARWPRRRLGLVYFTSG